MLRWTRFREITELRWGQEAEIHRATVSLGVRGIRVKHWGARLRRDYYRGYNGCVLERNGRRIIFGGDTAQTDSFAELNDARVDYIMPVHHQTFRLSFEPFREPIERFEAALENEPQRIALREIGETFVLPLY